MSDDSLILKVVTITLAAYGALLSTAIAVWNVYREITNRGRLRVRVNVAEMFAPGVGAIAKDKLWYKVTNVGRQPIWLSGRLASPFTAREVYRQEWTGLSVELTVTRQRPC